MAENYIDKIEVDGVERPIRDTSGSVRYDAAQTLTDAQKTQARENIEAAPAGYGLGTINVYGESYDANNCTQNGWYVCTVNTPNSEWWYILTVSNYANALIVQKAWYYNGGKVLESMRLGWLSKAEDQGGGWQPWEWVNPPMQLGVEFRTTERFFGKPVYVKVVNCGQISDGKEVEHGISNMDYCISAQGLMSGLALPLIINHDLSNTWSAYISQVTNTKIRFECGTSVVGNNIDAVLKYTKTTD